MSARPSGRMLPSAPAAELVEGLPAWPELDAAELAHVLDRAEALSAELDDEAAARVAGCVVAGAAGARLALAGRLTSERADELVAWAAEGGAATDDETRARLFPRVLLDVLAASPAAARTLEALLHVLVAFGAATGAELLGPGGRPTAAVGDAVGDDAIEVPVPDCEAVLRVSTPSSGVGRCKAFAEETARVLRTTVRAPSTAPAADAAKLEAAHRRLRRLALDLHDGPAQDVAALTADVAMLEADLAEEWTPDRLREAQALVAEVHARLSTLGRDVRDLAEVLEPRAILRAPLRDVLAREAAAFARRAGIEPTVAVDDDLGLMTASQQITLVRVAQEALTNVREHAGATAVSLTATATREGVSLVVEDDGRGFDPSRQTGDRLGLAGMHERVRMLAGRLAVVSRPGGPTRVEATIPRWRPSS